MRHPQVDKPHRFAIHLPYGLLAKMPQQENGYCNDNLDDTQTNDERFEPSYLANDMRHSQDEGASDEIS